MIRLMFHLVAVTLVLCQCERHERAKETPENPAAAVAVPKIARDRTADEADPMRELEDRRLAAEALPDGPERDRALSAVVWNALELDPELSTDLLAELEPGSRKRVRLIAHLAMRAADESPEAATAWAASLPVPEERQEAYARISVVMANADPLAATELLFRQVEEGRVRDRSTVQIIQRWSQSEPSAAAKWIESFPEGRLRSDALRECLGAWIKMDPAAAAEWINGLAEATLRDDATAVGETILDGRPPAEQTEFMNALEDPAIDQEVR